VQDIPPKPILLLAGATPPAGSVREGSGSMRVIAEVRRRFPSGAGKQGNPNP